MAFRRRVLVVAATVTSLFAQKPPAQKGGPVSERMELISKGKTAAAGINQFGLKLLEAEASLKPNTNVFLSPLSLYLALAMTEGGAAGKTQAAMRRVLEVPATTSDESMREAASALLQSLRMNRGVELSIANALWSSPKVPLSPAFVEQCRAVYDAEARSIDFQKPDAVDVINKWVSDKTKTRIPRIVTPEIVRSAFAMITNAVYFMGQWEREFPQTETREADFFLVSKATKKVQMMHQSRLKSSYRVGDGYEAAALSYKSSSIVMYAILPVEGISPEQALARAPADTLIKGNDRFDLELKLPKFTLDWSGKLKTTLTKLGMGVAFEFPGAEFAPLGSPLFYIGDVLHKTRLEVDEKGTVAAAATVVVVMVGSAAPRELPLKVLEFNRPFAVVIADALTGAELFKGVVYEP